jgi:hypothetical protein
VVLGWAAQQPIEAEARELSAGVAADRILPGEKSTDPPVQAPTRYEPGATVTTMMIKGVIGRDPAGGLYLFKEGRAALTALL